jgi:hypothetical protein
MLRSKFFFFHVKCRMSLIFCIRSKSLALLIKIVLFWNIFESPKINWDNDGGKEIWLCTLKSLGFTWEREWHSPTKDFYLVRSWCMASEMMTVCSDYLKSIRSIQSIVICRKKNQREKKCSFLYFLSTIYLFLNKNKRIITIQSTKYRSASTKKSALCFFSLWNDIHFLLKNWFYRRMKTKGSYYDGFLTQRKLILYIYNP